MSLENFTYALDHVLEWEGGFVDHPQDPGGATNMGITRRTLENHRDRKVTKAEVEALTEEEAEAIYEEEYWVRVQGDDLPAGLDIMVFDTAVNMGVYRASKLLQECVGASQDGIIGPNTLRATQEAWANSSDTVLQEYAALRGQAYARMSHFSVFGLGWMRRLMQTLQRAELVRFLNCPLSDIALRFKLNGSA